MPRPPHVISPSLLAGRSRRLDGGERAEVPCWWQDLYPTANLRPLRLRDTRKKKRSRRDSAFCEKATSPLVLPVRFWRQVAINSSAVIDPSFGYGGGDAA